MKNIRKTIYSAIALSCFSFGMFLIPAPASADCVTTVIDWYCNEDANGNKTCESKSSGGNLNRCKKPNKKKDR